MTTPTKKTGRSIYARPTIEIEFDQQALLAPGCCRFVPVVIRLCDLPEAHVIETIHFERTATNPACSPAGDYESHPQQPWNFRYTGRSFPRYHEFQVTFLARAHPKETGLFALKIESAAYTVLTEVTFVLQAGRSEPWIRGVAKGVRDYRFLPRLRSQEDRDALAGVFPSLGDVGS